MSTPKFTPGPWDQVVKMDGFTAVGTKTLIARVFSQTFRDSANEGANARLVAAAPDLHAACRLAHLMFQRKNTSTAEGDFMGDDEHEAWRAITGALAKVEGKL